MSMYEVRFYRDWVKTAGLVSFEVSLRESDLFVSAHRDLRHQAEDLLQRCRLDIESEIRRHPEFAESFSPLPVPPGAPPVVLTMLQTGRFYDVGPMAAVAGAVAQFVGEGLLQWSPEVIVENGGDIYMKMNRPVEMGLFAGKESPFSGKLLLRVEPAGDGLGVATSSGNVGHSLSFGRADAIVAVADNAALADAAATAIGNRVKSADNIEKVLHEEQTRGILRGLAVAVGKRFGAYGAIELSD